MAFDYSLNFEKVDFRAHPELYRVGRGEQGVLRVEPNKQRPLVKRAAFQSVTEMILMISEQFRQTR